MPSSGFCGYQAAQDAQTYMKAKHTEKINQKERKGRRKEGRKQETKRKKESAFGLKSHCGQGVKNDQGMSSAGNRQI